jgi:predicted metalloprotease
MWRGLNRAAYATFRWELMADCLAGMSTRHGVRTGVLNGTDFYEGQNELYALGDYAYSSRDHHGTPAQRKAWYTYGYNNAYNLYTCDPALSAAL